MPDQRGFGVFWIDREALAAAYDMTGAFNRVAVKLAPQADERAVVAALQRVLEPYGGREAHGRKEQVSHSMLDNEIKEQQVLGTMLPAIFLGVAAFLLNVVISRLVATQREQIAALKALGYANAAIAAHYLKLVGVIVAIGFDAYAGSRVALAYAFYCFALQVWLVQNFGIGSAFVPFWPGPHYFPILQAVSVAGVVLGIGLGQVALTLAVFGGIALAYVSGALVFPDDAPE